MLFKELGVEAGPLVGLLGIDQHFVEQAVHISAEHLGRRQVGDPAIGHHGREAVQRHLRTSVEEQPDLADLGLRR